MPLVPRSPLGVQPTGVPRESQTCPGQPVTPGSLNPAVACLEQAHHARPVVLKVALVKGHPGVAGVRAG